MARRDTSQVGLETSTERSWQVVGAVGLALLCMGALDILLALLPARIGQPDWEFATISAVVNGMPVPSMGAALMLASGIRLNSTARVVCAGVWALFIALVLAGAVILYLLDLPLAFRSVAEPGARRALLTAVTKTSVGFVVYVALQLYLIARCARFLRSGWSAP